MFQQKQKTKQKKTKIGTFETCHLGNLDHKTQDLPSCIILDPKICSPFLLI